MSNEEAHYWFAKVSNGKKRPALKAMRVFARRLSIRIIQNS
jgi:hypothetical protein